MKIKNAVTLFSALAIACLMAMPAAAQYVNRGELNNFNAFLNSHPRVAAELSRHPSLVDNKAYLDKHPELHSYLADHDDLRHAIQSHPGQFMYHDGRYSYGWGRAWGGVRGPEAWNNPAYRHEWEEMHNYGYYDPDDRQWHDREWWEHNRADWVREHHPNWEAAKADRREDYNEWRRHHEAEEHEEHEEHEEAQEHTHGHHDKGQHKGWNKQGHGHGQDND